MKRVSNAWLRGIKFSLVISAFGAGLALAGTQGLAAQKSGFLRVTGLSEGHVLWVRSGPNAKAKKIGFFPASARHIKSFGCRRALKGNWCQVRYRGVKGWASKRHLKPDIAQRV